MNRGRSAVAGLGVAFGSVLAGCSAEQDNRVTQSEVQPADFDSTTTSLLESLAATALPPHCVYEVQDGDTLSQIALEVTGSPATGNLESLNQISVADVIEAGQELNICLDTAAPATSLAELGGVEIFHIGGEAPTPIAATTTTVEAITIPASTTLVPEATIAPLETTSVPPETTAAPGTTAVTSTSVEAPIGNDCSTSVLEQGSVLNVADCVRLAQNILNILECNAGEEDAVFGPGTAYALRKFQSENNLIIDSIIGPLSWEALLSPDSKPCRQGDVDSYDLLACTPGKKCLLVHHINGLNTLQFVDENSNIIESTLVNTGMQGFRTKNTIVAEIGYEYFSSEQSEQETRADVGKDPKQWDRATRQVFDGKTVGLMYDPHQFFEGANFHGRVEYSGQHDENGKSIPLLDANGRVVEKNDYNGGYESHGCVHVLWIIIDKYDGTYFQVGVQVRILDQPVD